MVGSWGRWWGSWGRWDGVKWDLLVLRVPKLAEGVAGPPAVPREDVEIAVMSEEELAAVVIGRWLFNLQKDSTQVRAKV